MKLAADSLAPVAFHDCLAVTVGAPRSVAPFSITEVHLFSYLGCLLAVYEGQPVSDWGYQFALTRAGYPFSAQLDVAMRHLANSRLIQITTAEEVEPLEGAFEELCQLRTMPSWQGRRRWLDTAIECSLAMPVSIVKHAVIARDDLTGLAVSGPRAMISETYVARIHAERTAIEQALGGTPPNLLAPAVAWLSLYAMQRSDLAA